MPNQNLSQRIAQVDAQLQELSNRQERAEAVRAEDAREANRTRRGLTGAYREAVQARRLAGAAHERVDVVEGRVNSLEESTGLLETTAVAILDRLNTFAGLFRTQRADTARHEERISNHQVRINSLEARADADGNIVGVWAVTVTIIEVFLFIAWRVMAGWKNGLGQNLGDTPSYDTLFKWLAIGSVIVLSLVAVFIHLTRSRSAAAVAQTRQQEVAEDDTEVIAVNQQNDDETEEQPVVV